MIAITNYFVEEFGLPLTSACIEVQEVTSAETERYSDVNQTEGDPELKNTIVRFRVWIDEDAYLNGKRHIAEGVRQVNFTQANKDVLHNISLDLAFPESTIK